MTPIVATESGLIEGVPGAVPEVTAFRGIPYAADTAGDNRWRPPLPPVPWTGVRRADAFGDSCPQNQDHTNFPTSEDCLSLNVWTSADASDANLPVLVWIFGGRFIWGSTAAPEFDGSALAARGIVVVTINYRLGVFGFLSTPELSAESGHNASGNYGLMDQNAALEWVQRNIAAFGGSPNLVTIAGQSAGAASVMNHVYSPRTVGLFHGAIAQSGAMHPQDPGLDHVAAAYRSLPDAEREGEQFMAEHGIATLAQLRSAPVSALLEGNDANQPGTGALRPPLFRPVLDGWIFPSRYGAALATTASNDVPILTGTNKDEDGASPSPDVTLASFRERAFAEYGESAEEFFALYPASSDAEAAAASNAAARDRSRTSTFLWSGLRARHASRPTFRYFWTHPASGADGETRGAFHGSEIGYFLDTLNQTELPWTDEDHEIARTTSGYIARFIATGDPNGDGAPRWEASDAREPETMEIGDHFRAIPLADDARLRFFTGWLERQQPEW